MSATDPYAAVLALTEREHTLVAEGRHEEVPALDAERRVLLAALPAATPAHARGVLARAAAVQAHTTALLAAGMSELERELGRLSQGRAAVRGYGPGPSAPARRLDLAG
jgi:hypothetical protein